MSDTVENATFALGHLADEVHIATDRKTWQDIITGVNAHAPDEACTFVLARPSRGIRRTTLLLREVLWPMAGEVVATTQKLEVSADYISRALDAAIDAGP